MTAVAHTEYVIGEAVVASVAARAAAAVSGVVRLEPGLVGLVADWGRTIRQRWQGMTPAPADGVRVRIGEDAVTIQIDLVTSGFDQAAAVGQAVQRAVTRAVATQTGLAVDAVSVSIMDIEVSR
ncbi:Asp23/Gls24 family envelope stress response protein [Amycolatopsis suaedae]|uniref:Asp23/Gls24 family envelope stress response protein n=1 Tax=Amycolatopsis suaedae TaxID=2510978 RepID=A0A4Q7JEM9_9PSEU|nr:Asp23/Gls24 family envelope stress response protein [Amycolatopsis suaedae]RZQ65193.1 Asp23/Gls24 family envelope stress response protein [Amycolatopsis suaedae]